MKMIVTRPFRGKRQGEEFHVGPRIARILQAIGRAQPAPPAPPPEPEPTPRAPRTYKRRDIAPTATVVMHAEETPHGSEGATPAPAGGAGDMFAPAPSPQPAADE